MRRASLRHLALAAVLLGVFGVAPSVHAQLEVGTWLRQSGDAAPGSMTMTVERCCGNGRRILYRMEGDPSVMTIESRFDGSEAPVLLDGKPTGESMAIKRLDEHHAFTVVRTNGKEFGTSKATLSPDGRTITVENDFTSSVGSHSAGKNTEIWVRK